MGYEDFQRMTIANRTPQEKMQAQIALVDEILDRATAAAPAKRQEKKNEQDS